MEIRTEEDYQKVLYVHGLMKAQKPANNFILHLSQKTLDQIEIGGAEEILELERAMKSWKER